MCGIAGIVNFERAEPVNRALVLSMTRTLAHRGPDAEGLHVAGNVGLGHRRLSIIDLSTSADQPMSNERGDVWIVYNGEVYNFQQVRDELEAAGVQFRTRSDTEVVLRAYEHRGLDFVESLKGMFALAIWDRRDHKLVLARDRFGIKPLYYHVGSSYLSFASELKALLVDPRTPRDIDPGALSDYLHLLSIPDPRSILRGVLKLRPGHVMVLKDGKVTQREYWRIPLVERPPPMSLEDACAGFEERFGESVRSHLVADVPVGAFLSGGVDSSAVVAFMEPEASAGMYTFSTTFRGEGTFDEGPFARQVAERYRTTHLEVDLGHDAAEALPLMAWHCDEPFAVSSALALYFLSRMAREKVKVVLTGDGGDEVFAGYTWKHTDFPRLPANLPRPARRMLRALLGLGRSFAPRSKVWRRLETFAAPDERFLRAFACMNNEDLAPLVNPQLWPALESAWSHNVSQRYYDESWRYPEQTRKLYTDIRSTLTSEMLTKVDRLTMAAGLEARVPFLDHQLVEWAFSLPPELKLQAGEGKLVVKRALESRLPREILYRPKHGFNVPLGRWLRGELREMTRDLLSPDTVRSRGIFDPGAVTALLDRHQASADAVGNQVFVLMMLELWWREVLERPTADSSQVV